MARSLTFGHGWNSAAPGEARWAHGPAALSYYNPMKNPVCANVRFVMSGVGERHLQISVNGTEKFDAFLFCDGRIVGARRYDESAPSEAVHCRSPEHGGIEE